MTVAKEFHRACFQVARATGRELTAFTDTGGRVAPDFHQAILSRHEHSIAVLRSRRFAALTFTEPQDPATFPKTFVDAPELAEAFLEILDVRVLSADELARDFGKQARAEFPHLDPNDLAYWRPGTLGEALFTHWD
ncbi:hypothetical protein [Amycolatopsis sp. H20-H5]|uniref:hypothetical protein n=1 Tax=Amycolatopsis sp. H20-H5 TaxID=3046309 RepID=UPI002DBD25F8|nr:hypothetical protein [Amycolatopsis sp. H20-H5]MEC3982269.1 hypothetical protein [Amycolatopsis sp. H20-H5]